MIDNDDTYDQNFRTDRGMPVRCIHLMGNVYDSRVSDAVRFRNVKQIVLKIHLSHGQLNCQISKLCLCLLWYHDCKRISLCDE